MIDQTILNEFVGAKVKLPVPINNSSHNDGRIDAVNLTADEDEILFTVSCADGKKRKYDIDHMEFEDESLQEKAHEICAQLFEESAAITETDPKEETVYITIDGRTSKIGSNYHPEFMATKPVLTLDEVEEELGVNMRFRGINYSQYSPNIVIVSVLKEYVDYFVYPDYWDKNEEFIYTGEGLHGDQKFARGNLAIRNAKSDGKHIHLFIKPYPNTYVYQGEFELIDWFWNKEPGADGIIRNAIKFRLRKIRRD